MIDAPRRPLGSTGLSVHPVGLGTNTFGWSADEEAAHAVLDAYAQAGGNHIDTAHTYPGWVPGREGGESEEMIGNWLASRPAVRERMVIATKVGMAAGRFEKGLRGDQIAHWIEGCLQRLGVDRIDLFYTHEDDWETPLEETLEALDGLVRRGVVAHLGASNISAPRLAQALRISDANGWARYAVLQPGYNLVRRDAYEGELADLCVAEGLAVCPYPALAGGFLTGKYRAGREPQRSVRARRAQAAAESPQGQAVLAELDRIAEVHGATPGQVAVAWLLTRPAVTSALVSATRPEQIAEIMPAAGLRLSERHLAGLTAAAATP
jgi:aryl-alcohol dehydrogenase-like predicted oxidoreductase